MDGSGFISNKAFRLVALLIAMVALASPSLALASAKWTWITRCCCPDPTDCHCPGQSHNDEKDADADEHGDGDKAPQPSKMNRCNNAGEFANVTMQAAMAPAPLVTFAKIAVTTRIWIPMPLTTPQSRWLSVETPPF